MGLKAGPYDSAKIARTVLVEAGYLDKPEPGRRPPRWVHRSGTKGTRGFAIQILKGNRAKIIPYPDLRRIDYRVTSDREREEQFRTSLKGGSGRRPRT